MEQAARVARGRSNTANTLNYPRGQQTATSHFAQHRGHTTHTSPTLPPSTTSSRPTMVSPRSPTRPSFLPTTMPSCPPAAHLDAGHHAQAIRRRKLHAPWFFRESATTIRIGNDEAEKGGYSYHGQKAFFVNVNLRRHLRDSTSCVELCMVERRRHNPLVGLHLREV